MFIKKLEKMFKFSNSRLDTDIEFSCFPRFTIMFIDEKNSQNPSLKIINLCSFNKSVQIFQ